MSSPVDLDRPPSGGAGLWGLTVDETRALAGRRVLWVEDHQPTLAWAIRLCEACSIGVTGATTAAEGSRLAVSRDFDTVVLDLMLGSSRGTTVLRDLRAAGRQTPVIVLTAYGDDRTAFELGRLGATRYLAKPVDTETMLRELASVLIGQSVDRPSIWNAGCRNLRSVRSLVNALDGRGADLTADGPWRALACRAALDAVVDPALTDLVIWYACLEAFRRLFIARSAESPAAATRARDVLLTAIAPRRPLSFLLCRALMLIERSGSAWERLGEEAMARELGRSRARFSAALVQSTGLSFPAWRCGSAFRGAVRLLVETDEPVKAIAGRQGYSHVPHFARHVVTYSGLSPAALREIARVRPAT